MTILVVDDDDRVSYGLTRWIEGWARRARHDVKVIGARSLEEGVRIANLEQPRLILLDNHLPDGQGARAVRKIRRASNNSMMIVMSGGMSEEDADAALQAGAGATISKVDLGQLGHVLTRFLARASGFALH
jgi:DNA-binding response OmpR family regulator